MNKEEREFELAILNAKASGVAKIDVMTHLINEGLPLEVVTRTSSLWDKTQIIANKVVHIGKIIVLKIMEFIAENPHLTIGIAIGAAVGAMVYLVPFLGSFLAPLTFVLICMFFVLIGQDLFFKALYYLAPLFSEAALLCYMRELCLGRQLIK